MANQKISELPTVTGSQMADSDKFVLVHAGSSVAATRSQLFRSIPDITLDDSYKILLGDSSDLQIFHDGTHSIISEVGVGNLFLRSNGGGIIMQATTDQDSVVAAANGAVTLYHNGNIKLFTSETGVSLAGNAEFGDNGKAIFGASSDLQIFHDGANSIISEGGAGNLYLRSNGGGIIMQATTGQDSFSAIANGAVNLHHSGNLKLATSATGISVAGVVSSTSLSSTLLTLNRTGNGIVTQFKRDQVAVGSITVGVNSTAYVTSSDYRLKTGAQPMTDVVERVQALNPVNFEWISDGSRVDGFIAHEVQEVVPEAIIGERDAMRDEEYEVTPAVLDEDGNVTTEAVMGTRSVNDYQGIDQSKLVPLLTAALQEALAEISSLKSRVEALEG